MQLLQSFLNWLWLIWIWKLQCRFNDMWPLPHEKYQMNKFWWEKGGNGSWCSAFSVQEFHQWCFALNFTLRSQHASHDISPATFIFISCSQRKISFAVSVYATWQKNTVNRSLEWRAEILLKLVPTAHWFTVSSAAHKKQTFWRVGFVWRRGCW